jgi:hypothetical protein
MSQNTLHFTGSGVFDAESNLFARYAARIMFRNKVVGGVPKDPKLIEGWLRAKAGIADDLEIREAMLRTLVEIGATVS